MVERLYLVCALHMVAILRGPNKPLTSSLEHRSFFVLVRSCAGVQGRQHPVGAREDDGSSQTGV
jgi:hypothetical protein